MAKEQSIELDCPPGGTRPDNLLPGVIEGTGLEVREPVVKLFGHYKWDYQDIDPTRWEEVQKVTEPRIKALYYAGRIRYGSW